jgi:hypothetical protein
MRPQAVVLAAYEESVMSPRKFIVSSGFAAALLVSVGAAADSSHQHGDGCTLAGYTIAEVAPYRVREQVGRGTVERVAGAQLFVPAKAGLTRELIGANVLAHLERMRKGSMAGCPLDVDGITVTVASGSTGYWVQIAGTNARDAKEILARARHFAR